MTLKFLKTVLSILALALLCAPAIAADIMPMPYVVGKGHPDPTRPGVMVPTLTEYIAQLRENDDARAKELGDGLCAIKLRVDGKLTSDLPISDFWQESKDRVVLLLVKRENMVLCDWTTQPDTRKVNPVLSKPLCAPAKAGKAQPDRSGQVPAYWFCRHCSGSQCPAP